MIPSIGIIPSIGMPEIIVILVVVLIIFGPGKLPEVGKSIGKAIGEFRKASTDVKKEFDTVIQIEEPNNTKS